MFHVEQNKALSNFMMRPDFWLHLSQRLLNLRSFKFIISLQLSFPHVLFFKLENSLTVTSFKNCCKPCVPKGIRFWFGAKSVVCEPNIQHDYLKNMNIKQLAFKNFRSFFAHLKKFSVFNK